MDSAATQAKRVEELERRVGDLCRDLDKVRQDRDEQRAAAAERVMLGRDASKFEQRVRRLEDRLRTVEDAKRLAAESLGKAQEGLTAARRNDAEQRLTVLKGQFEDCGLDMQRAVAELFAAAARLDELFSEANGLVTTHGIKHPSKFIGTGWQWLLFVSKPSAFLLNQWLSAEFNKGRASFAKMIVAAGAKR